MRIIGGKHRGTSLYEFKGQAVRPTADRTKEAIFNVLQSDISGSVCLDLFCGSGSLGIEAISRGAKEVVFVDKSKESVALAEKNLDKIREKGKVYFTDALSFLERANKKFDIIFIDPPYADDVSVLSVKKIIEKDLLSDDGIIVFERDKPCRKVDGASVYDVRKYGKAVISFIRKTKRCLFAGSFDPVTLGHEAVVKKIEKSYDEIYVVAMQNENKTPFFSLKERERILKAAFGGREKVIVDSWDGMLTDYMKGKGLKVNVRGIRSDEDLVYEKEMEEINRSRFPEIIYDYVYTDCPISSSAAREAIGSGSPILNFVSKSTSEEIDKIREEKA